MQFYQYDNKGLWIRSAIAQPSPLEPGEFMMPANATLTAPPEHNANEYVIWLDDKWEVRQRRAGVYWHKITLEVLEVSDPVEIDLTDYTNVQPPAHQSGDSVKFADNKWQVVLGKIGIKVYRQKITQKINKRCESAILAEYSRDDQRNIDREALPLVGLAISGNDLTEEQENVLNKHKQMRELINQSLQVARDRKAEVETATQQQLIAIEANLDGE